jgi:hypothetical protein
MRDDDFTPRGHSSAYPFAADRYKYVALIIGSLLMMIWMKAAVNRDYRSDAELYLRSHGREEALETVMPLSSSELAAVEMEMFEKDKVEKQQQQLEEKNKEEELLAKVVTLQAKVDLLQSNQPDETKSVRQLEETIKSLETRLAIVEAENEGLKSLASKVSALEQLTGHQLKSIESKIEVIETLQESLKNAESHDRRETGEQSMHAKFAQREQQEQQQQQPEPAVPHTQAEELFPPAEITSEMVQHSDHHNLVAGEDVAGEESSSLSRAAALEKRREAERRERIRKREAERKKTEGI